MIADSLYQLQQIDETTRAKQRRLAEVEARLGESGRLREARARLDRAQKALHDLEKKQRGQELELQGIANKLHTEEERLYSGQVRNPKELAGLQKEVRYLKQRHAELEDSLLETMMSREEATHRVREREATLRQIEGEWEQDQADLLTERADLQAAISEARGRRTELVKQIPAAALSTYEYLLRTKGFAVARVENGMCVGCRVSLSAVDRQRVQSEELVTCGNCGRVLVQT